MSAANREALEQRLAKLLGISTNEDDHEYVTDIFNSLVDIGDNTDDVVEYLTNFGGDGNLRDFAIDLKKFKDGDDDDIILSSATDIKEDEKPPAPSTVGEPKPKAKIILDEAAAQREEIKRREMEAREKQRMEQEFMKKKKMEEEEEQQHKRRDMEAAVAKQKLAENQWGNNKAGISTPIAPQNQKKGGGLQQTQTNVKNMKQQQQAKKTDSKSIASKKQQQSKPQKGKPKNKCCGCYGNKHKPLTNCLHCGRISCEIEGYDYCHFCNNLIQDAAEIIGNAENVNIDDSALRHKERLLEFDRTYAQRTAIHDDQEDYFVAASSMWSSEQEQEDARIMEEERRKKLHERQKQTLNINF